VTDPREPYGRIFHEQGRLTVNAEREKPFAVEAWEDRTDEQREIDMRGASAVAVQAVADAKARNERLEAQVFALGAHLPAILGALRARLAVSPHGNDAKPYRAALAALRGGDDQERTDKEGTEQ
jgi:hypothetical protein